MRCDPIYLLADSKRKYCDAQLLSNQMVVFLRWHTNAVPVYFYGNYLLAYAQCTCEIFASHYEITYLSWWLVIFFPPHSARRLVGFSPLSRSYMHENMFIYPSNFPPMRVFTCEWLVFQYISGVCHVRCCVFIWRATVAAGDWTIFPSILLVQSFEGIYCTPLNGVQNSERPNAGWSKRNPTENPRRKSE